MSLSKTPAPLCQTLHWVFRNVSKTSYMIISNQKNALDIKIRETILTKVSTVKFLGVIRLMKILFLRTM